MKTLILIVSLALSFNAMAEPGEDCLAFGRLAESVMNVRQIPMPIELVKYEANKTAQSPEVSRLTNMLIDYAYAVDLVYGDSNKSLIIAAFKDRAYKLCMEERI